MQIFNVHLTLNIENIILSSPAMQKKTCIANIYFMYDFINNFYFVL